MEEEQKKKRGPVFAAIAVLAVLLGIGSYVGYHAMQPRGYQDYTIQKMQYFVEYSEQFAYWDVLTIEYPCLSGIEGQQTESINKIFYDTAFDKVNYWHLYPDEEVKALQEEYHIFSSDVLCSVPYHSQYLASVHFEEIYAPVSPVYYVHKTERAANVDLATGEEYKLSDVIQIDDAFVGFWCEQIDKSEEYDDLAFGDKEVRESFVAWFLGKDEKLDEYYMFNPFFYIDENKDLVIGISCDPKPSIVGGYMPSDDSFSVRIEYGALEPYRIDSEFWDLYEKSESTGEVLECEDLKENLWLGKDAGVWDMWKE